MPARSPVQTPSLLFGTVIICAVLTALSAFRPMLPLGSRTRGADAQIITGRKLIAADGSTWASDDVHRRADAAHHYAASGTEQRRASLARAAKREDSGLTPGVRRFARPETSRAVSGMMMSLLRSSIGARLTAVYLSDANRRYSPSESGALRSSHPNWFVAECLCEIPHISLLTPAMEKNSTRIDRRTLRGEMVGDRKE